MSKKPSSRDSKSRKQSSTKENLTQKSAKDVDSEASKEDLDQKVQHIETEGFGRFEFIDGTIYDGQWKLVNTVRMRHGEGTLKHGGATGTESGEEYKGTWKEDQMHGYGVYRYTSGAVYSGEWLNGKQEGKGCYEFADGSKYEGEWKDHRMHGEGTYTDIDGNKWQGIFVEGVYQSKMQKQLKLERIMNKMESDIREDVTKFFEKFETAFTSGDKKTWKDHLTPFFALQDDVKTYFREPFPRYEEKKPDQWNDSFKFLSEYTTCNILRKIDHAKIVDPQNIIAEQFNGLGQIVEFERFTEERTIRLGLCNTADHTWTIVYFFDTYQGK